MPKSKKTESDSQERLHKRIARSGLTSRRKAEELIREGRVTVNGSLIVEMGVQVSPEDDVRVDGVPLQKPRDYYLVINKPKGVLTTMDDPQRRPTIVSFFPTQDAGVKPVGRLDKDTSGLIVCTNNGQFALRLAHPRYGVDKEYHAIVEGIPEEKSLDKLRKGIYIEGGKTMPAKVEIIHAEPKRNSTSLRITIHEGRNRQVRNMCDAIGHKVIELSRTRIGPLVLKGMKPGECRAIGKQDLDLLFQELGLDQPVVKPVERKGRVK